MSENYNEKERVQVPALVHLTRIGYTYYGKISNSDAGKKYDPDTNILINVFKAQFAKLNPGHEGEEEQVLQDIRKELNFDDLGRSFYTRLTSVSPVKLIDFEHPQNNVFHCTGEFTCKNGDEEFRPDITLFINGLPLVFVEVKKPQNAGGMLAESKRMNDIRFPNKKFRRFINITQLMIFSNNEEYDAEGGTIPIQGAFYCTAARKETPFNCFREENPYAEAEAPYHELYPYTPIDPLTEKWIMTEFNCQVIHNTPEYLTNVQYNTPTNRILTSMVSPERLLFLLKYGIAYVRDEREVDGKQENTDQKHIMRYQQMFGAMAVREKLSEGAKSGVIWHTQGSGKTALAYYMHAVLTDFYAKQNKVAKFYFIVDRLDLLEQAKQEFEARGLSVQTAQTREELMRQFRMNQAREGAAGKPEITVVNIQRFAEDHEKVEINRYATNLQRIFIVDEAHRGYKPEGSFLGNLFNADPDSVKIAMTGTPLLKKERESWKIFGNYFHTYYYDKSIKDGYTLKIIREEIETRYKEDLKKIQENLEVYIRKKSLKKEDVMEHENYVKALLRFIVSDFNDFRRSRGDDTLGAMVICQSSGQAKKLYEYFEEIQNELNRDTKNPSALKAGLILHDSDDKETRKGIITDFKKNMKIDILFVFNMLLTGFDAPRLKRLYFGRKLKDHNLLQAITRVNRPYKGYRYGYVIDFADIKSNFDETNKRYLEELNRFNDPDETGAGNNTSTYFDMLENPEELIRKMKEAENELFLYTTDNLEIFSREISAVEDKNVLYRLRRILVDARDSRNIVRTFGDEDIKEKFKGLDIENLPDMIAEITRCIDRINMKSMLLTFDADKIAINRAMEFITFDFRKLSTEELRIVSGGEELQRKTRKTLEEFARNFDQEDEEYISLMEAFQECFQKNGFVIRDMKDYERSLADLKFYDDRISELNRKNEKLAQKYGDDYKYVRLHKRICEQNSARLARGEPPIISRADSEICKALKGIKRKIDKEVYDRSNILNKDAYFEKEVMSLIKRSMDDSDIKASSDDRKFIQKKIVAEYIEQYKAQYSVY